MKAINVIALVLIILGALNWGVWGFFQFDFISWIFDGNTTGGSRTVYCILGLAGLWSINMLSRGQFLGYEKKED